MSRDRSKFIIASFLTISFLLYSVYLYSSLPEKNTLVNASISDGKLTWQKYNCGACHQIYGLGGYLGPDLTNVYSLKGPDYIKAFLNNGTTIMPKFQLKEQEVKDLQAYLRNIDASGSADPRSFTIKYDGTIEQ